MGINTLFKVRSKQPISKCNTSIDLSFSFETNSSSSFASESGSDGTSSIVSHPTKKFCFCGELQSDIFNSDKGGEDKEQNIEDLDPARLPSIFHVLDLAVDKVVENLVPTPKEGPQIEDTHSTTEPKKVWKEVNNLPSPPDGQKFTDIVKAAPYICAIVNDDERSQVTSDSPSDWWPSFWPTEEVQNADGALPHSPENNKHPDIFTEELVDLSKPLERRQSKITKLKKKIRKIKCFNRSGQQSEIRRLTKSETEWFKRTTKESKEYVGILY